MLVFEAREVLRPIFARWGIEGPGPQWSIPETPQEETGWSRMETWTVRFPSHPQETTENSVAMAHLRYVHGYNNMHRVGITSIDQHLLESRFNFKRARRIAGIMTFTFDVSANAHIYGLGYSFVEMHEQSIGMDARLWMLATPVDGALIDPALASQVQEMRSPSRWPA